MVNWFKKLFEKKVVPGTVQRATRVVDFDRVRGSIEDEMYHGNINAPAAPLDVANIVTSESADIYGQPDLRDIHYPVIDIDFPVTVVPSTTPGHSHLYIDKAMDFDEYVCLLQCLADYGLVEQGYADAVEAQGFGILRLPWVKKEARPHRTSLDQALALVEETQDLTLFFDEVK